MSNRKKPQGQLKTEFMVGLFFIVAMLILTYFTILLGPTGGLFAKQNMLVAEFQEVGALKQGDNVRFRGVPIGKVSKISVTPKNVTVEMYVNKDLKLTFFKNYKISINSSSFLGGQFVSLATGTAESGKTSDSPLKGSGSADVMADAGKLINSLREDEKHLNKLLEKEKILEKVADITNNLKQASEDIKMVTAKVRKGEGSIGELLIKDDFIRKAETTLENIGKTGDSITQAANELQKFGESLNTSINSGKGTIGRLLNDEELYKKIQGIVADFKTFSGNLSKQDNSISKLMNDNGKLYQSLQEAFSNLSEISKKINKGEGTLAKIINDKELYESIKQTIDEVKNAIQDFREQAPIATFGGLIFGGF